MKRKTILLLLIILTSNLGKAQEKKAASHHTLVEQLMGKDSLVDRVLQNREAFRFQFMLTEVAQNESETGINLIQHHDYSNRSWYFYPASIVKLPIALMSLEKLKEMDFPITAQLIFSEDFTCGNMSFVEESIQKKTNFEEMIRKLIIVSNNTYYNSLYHFLTPKKINEELKQKQFSTSSIYKDFTGCELPLNLKTHEFNVESAIPMRSYHQEGSTIELSDFAVNYPYDSTKLLGSKHEYRGKIVDGPFDFNYNLDYSLKDIHSTSMRLFFPEKFPEDQRWDLRESDREFLLNAMKSVPKDLGEKEFLNTKNYPDNLYKYIVLGDENPDYDSVITYSKIGISYGFVTETAYVIDQRTNKQFVLTASIYVNSNDTVNDGKYEYEEVARPFLAKFGQLLLELE